MNYLSDLFKVLKQRFDGNITWNDVSEFERKNGRNLNGDSCRRNAVYLNAFLRDGWKLTPPGENLDIIELDETQKPAGVEYNSKDDTYTRTKMISIKEGEIITPELIMEKHQVDPEKWEVVTYKNNYWNSQKKGGELLTLFQSKLTVRPKKTDELDLTAIDTYFNNKDWNVKPAEVKFPYNASDEYLEIDITDSHIGLLSYIQDTGENYDVEIASERIKALFSDIKARCKDRKFKLINLCTLGDILHVDNFNNTTAHGTPQDTEGRITKWFGLAVDLMIECIDMLLELECPLQYTYLCGNHDITSGYMLAKAVSVAYINNPNIKFDIRPLPQKAVVYGNTLVGLCHGDMAKNNLGAWLAQTYRKEYGETKFAQVHCGHLHSEAVKAGDNGILIYRLPKVCSSSYWEKSMGYIGERGMMCFIYNGTTGLRDMWYSYI